MHKPFRLKPRAMDTTIRSRFWGEGLAAGHRSCDG